MVYCICYTYITGPSALPDKYAQASAFPDIIIVDMPVVGWGGCIYCAIDIIAVDIDVAQGGAKGAEAPPLLF